MAASTLLSLGALGALLPATLAAYLRGESRDFVFWVLTAVATAVPLLWAGLRLQSAWNAGFAVSLWLSVGVTLVLFVVLAAGTRSAWRLAPILFPYLVGLGALATVWSASPGSPLAQGAFTAWLPVHIAIALAAYGLITLAAVAAAAVAAQESALKQKQPNRLSRLLPAVRDAEALQMQLLMAGEGVLGAGLITGMALEYLSESHLLRPDHKTVFVLATFLVIGALILVHLRSGLRGRMAARWVLVAYLLLTLGYPGVKFVTDVLLS
ncbi:MAG: hypothetical protein EXQ88_01840 [Alphaproteobacteria bacterium]|nr:hypothetical protein [Alphaproteobacteria bacterium]